MVIEGNNFHHITIALSVVSLTAGIVVPLCHHLKNIQTKEQRHMEEARSRAEVERAQLIKDAVESLNNQAVMAHLVGLEKRLDQTNERLEKLTDTITEVFTTMAKHR